MKRPTECKWRHITGEEMRKLESSFKEREEAGNPYSEERKEFLRDMFREERDTLRRELLSLITQEGEEEECSTTQVRT